MQFLQIQELNQSLVQTRHQQGSEVCSQAFTRLARLMQQNFDRREDLLQAIADFGRAIRLMRGEAEPYIGMGYLLMLARDFVRAERYLLQALRLAPRQPDALALLETLPTRKAAAIQPVRTARVRPRDPGNIPDPDQLFDRLNQEIMAEVRAIMLRPPSQLAMQAEALAGLREQESAMMNQLQEWNRLLEALEAQLEVCELRKLLKPYETARHRLAKDCGLIQQGLELRRDIEAELSRVKPLFRLVNHASGLAELEGMEARLEGLQDICDSLADRLDSLEQQSVSLAGLLPEYERLIYLVEQLGETCDDKFTELRA